MANLYLFTLSFPYSEGGETTFLQDEVKSLVKEFDTVIVIPRVTKGTFKKLNDKILIDYSLVEFLKENKRSFIYYFRAVFSKCFFLELYYLKARNIRYHFIKKIISYISEALIVKDWGRTYVGLLSGRNVLYTYWCTPTTLGLGLFKKGNNETKLVSRAHGLDLYEERKNVFCRRSTLSLIDRLYTISEHGYNYTASRYPEFKKAIAISRLGIRGNLGQSQILSDGSFLIVSCSTIDPNKQVNLVFEGLLKSALIFNKVIFEWHHFGEGPGKEKLEIEIKAHQIVNLKCFLHGFIKNEDLLEFYTKNRVDIFINTSLSEGIPVSIMEAQSFGIPVIATKVGGTPEIVNVKAGILLSPNAQADEICEGINWFVENPDKALELRLGSLRNWKENFNAENIFSAFAHSLSELLKS